MNPADPFLALIGHGIIGNDGIEPGIHLRWQFRSEMGFPLGGFVLYRRETSSRGQPICIDFQGMRSGDRTTEFTIGRVPSRLTFGNLGAPLYMETRSLTDEPFHAADPVHLPRTDPGRPAGRRRLSVLSVPDARFSINLPEHVYRVTLHVEFKPGPLAISQIHVRGYADGTEVARTGARSRVAGIRSISLQATVLDRLSITARSVALIKICYWPIESCEEEDAWEQVREPICLPIFYPGKPCRGRGGPDCDGLEVGDRLPRDPCERKRYEGIVPDLVDSLRLLVDQHPTVPQGERLFVSSVEADDCPPPGEPMPAIEIPVVDALNLAAFDPAVARVLGLYTVDHPQPKGGAFDYKIVGDWPEGTLWSLPESLSFDDLPEGKRFFLNFFPAGPLAFKARIRPTVVQRPSPQLGTRHALAFLETDGFDWNLPPVPGPHLPSGDETVNILFPEPVGEVQVYLGQETPNVTLQAFDDNGPVSAEIRSTRRDDVLAIHAENQGDQITRVVLKGSRFWLHRISWGPERIAHGVHCAYAYGLAEKAASRPQKPRGIQAYPLPGLVRKEPDCEPLMEGQTSDARLSVGVTWNIPESGEHLQPDAPVAYDVYRVDAANRAVLLTAEQPVIVAPPDDDADLPPYEPPPGWPPSPPNFIDAAVEPGTYRYYVVGQSIFGARSEESDRSAPVTPVLPAPTAPTMSNAYFIDPADPRLSAEDRAALPGDSGEAIRLRWNWPEGAARSSPDAHSFRVYYSPGRPNVLTGEIRAVTDQGSEGLSVEVELAGINDVPQHLLAGRQLVQAGRRFRIIEHQPGIMYEGRMIVELRLRRPPKPSRNSPRVGACLIPLDATIPVEIRAMKEAGNAIVAELHTAALSAEPYGGLAGGEVRLLDARVQLDSTSNPNYGVSGSRFAARFRPPDGVGVEAFLRSIRLPLFTALSLPPPGTNVYRDYSDPSAWPRQFGTSIPRTTAGDFDLLIRRKATGESPSLEQVEPGKYMLVVDALPAGLEVSPETLRRDMAFGVSCLGPNGTESAVSTPVVLTRIHRGNIGTPGQLAELDALEPEVAPIPGERIYASSPNYEGKSIYSFSWPAQDGWTYEVYRALDESIYAFDRRIRTQIDDAGNPVRSRDVSDYADLLNNLTAGMTTSDADFAKDLIENFIIQPVELDRDAIEAHAHVDMLLQTLASLPLNDQAFTRLNLNLEDEPGPPSKVVCRDNTLEGRARGRYFYRVRAINAVANASPLGLSSPPVCVKGVSRPPAPVMTKIQGGDRQITICWAATRDTSIKGLLVYRTDNEVRANDWRQMDVLKQNDADEYSVELSDQTPNKFEDATVEPYKGYFYGIVAANTNGSKSRMSTVKLAMAYDYSQPDEPTWHRSEWVKLDENGIEHSWNDPAQELIRAVALEFSTTSRNVAVIVKRKGTNSDFVSVSSWLKEPSFDEVSGCWRFLFHDTGGDVNGENTYRLKLRNKAGIILDSQQERSALPPAN